MKLRNLKDIFLSGHGNEMIGLIAIGIMFGICIYAWRKLS
jgi:hypothetical protein